MVETGQIDHTLGGEEEGGWLERSDSKNQPTHLTNTTSFTRRFAPRPSLPTLRRMHNLHLSDSEYSANFGVKALQKEFGEVQIYTPVAVTRMDEERKKKVSSVTEASLKMQRTIRVLRSAIRTYNQNRKPDDLVTLKEALANSGVVLQKSAANRRNSRRTSEVR